VGRIDLVFVVCYVASLIQTGIGYLSPGLNQEMQVPLVQMLNDPALFPGDPFMATMPYYPSMVWRVVALLGRAVPLPALLVTLLLLERWLLLWSAGRLARALAPGSRLAVVGAWTMFALAPQPIIGNGTLVIHEFEQTGLAVALLLLATAALIEKRPLAWGVWMGLAINANFLYTLFALTYHAALSGVERPDRGGRRRWLVALATLAVLAAPVALLSLRAARFTTSDPDLWIRALRAYYPHHFFPDMWSRSGFGRLAALALLAVGVPLLYLGRPAYARRAGAVTLVCLGWLALAVLNATVLRVPNVFVLHPVRASDFWYCYAPLLLIGLFAAQVEESRLTRYRWTSLAGFALAVFGAGTLIGSPKRTLAGLALVMALVAAVDLCSRRLGRLPSRATLRRTVVIALMFTVGGISYRVAAVPQGGVVSPFALECLHESVPESYDLRPHGPLALFKGPDPDLAEVAAWARDHTGRDAVFLVPPAWGAFRALSERPVFVTWKDGGATMWRKDYVTEWVRRIAALGVDASRSTPGEWTLPARLCAAWVKLDPRHVSALRPRYRIDYWVAPISTAVGAPVVHVNHRVKVVALDGVEPRRTPASFRGS
jgi:hypothetical protein